MITFSADIRSACATSDDVITTGSVGIPVQLNLSADFAGLAKTLVFSNGSTAVDLALVGDATEATVPSDVLTTPDVLLQIGIYAADASGNIVIPTIFANVDLIRQGAAPSGVDPSEPTPSWAAQVQQMASEAVETSEQVDQRMNDLETEISGDLARAKAYADAAEEQAGHAESNAKSAFRDAEAAASSAQLAGASKNAASAAKDAAALSATEAKGAAEYASAALQAIEEEIGKILTYYPALVRGRGNTNTGRIVESDTVRNRLVSMAYMKTEDFDEMILAPGYQAIVFYYDAADAFLGATPWLAVSQKLNTSNPRFRVQVRNADNSEFADTQNNAVGFVNSRFFDSIRRTYTIGATDNVAKVITEAMQYRGSVVYIEPYEHDCIAEWEALYGAGYFAQMATGRGLELYNDVHIIGRPGHKLTCHYTGTNDYVMAKFSLFNNPAGGSGYSLEGLNIEASRIRYCIHDERSSDPTPYKVKYSRCTMSQDQTGSTWDRSRACIGGGLGMHGDVVVEDCIFSTVTSAEHLDSLAYHNSAAADAISNVVVKNCYCAGNSTIQLAAYGDSTLKTPVLVVNCSVGSPLEILDWSGNANFEILQIGVVVRT